VSEQAAVDASLAIFDAFNRNDLDAAIGGGALVAD
jgi:hypothetical protein